MMADLNNGDVCNLPEMVDIHEDNAKPVHEEFWDLYAEYGISTATEYFEMFTNGDVAFANEKVKDILDEAKVRGIDMVALLQEWDKYQEGLKNGSEGEAAE